MPDRCPYCEAELVQVDHGHKFNRIIGREVRGEYDGVLIWVCPDCHESWPRFEDGPLHDKAMAYL